MPIGTPAGILNVLVIANTGQANAALTKTRAAFRLTGVSAQESAAASSASWKRAGAAVGLAAAAISAASGKVAIDFDKSMRNVNSIAQLPEKQFLKLEKSALKLAGPAAQAPVTIAEGMYTLVSSGFDAKEALTVVEQSARGATAGLTETEVSTKAVAAVLNAYQRPAKDAKDVTDTLFRTVDKGVISFEDLAQNIGDTLPFAATLKVSLSEVGAAVSTLTRQGLSASETMTRIRNVLQTLIKPGTDLKDTFKELNTTGSELVDKKGLQGALDTLIGTTDGTKEAVAKLFPNIRALGGALALTGENSKRANKLLDQLKNHSGATSRALSQQSKSVSFQWNQAKAEVTKLAIEFGNVLLPVFFDGIDVFVDVAGAVFDVAQALAHLDGTAQTVVLSMGGAALATGAFIKMAPLVVGFASNVGFLAGMMGTAAVQGTVLTTTMTLLGTALRAHPILTIAAGVGLAVGAVAGLASAFGGLFSSEKEIPDLQQRVIDTSDRMKDSLEGQRTAIAALDSSAGKVRKSHKRSKDATKEVSKAEDHYQDILGRYPKDSRQAARALAELTEAKKKARIATKQAEKAEREHGAMRQSTKPILRETLAAERAATFALKDHRKELFEDLRAQNKYGATLEDRKALQEELDKNLKELTRSRRAENNTIREATQKIGPAFAKSISDMSQSQLEFGKRTIRASRVLEDPYKKTILDLESPISKIRTETGKLGKAFQESSQTGAEAINRLNKNYKHAADTLNLNVPGFGVSTGGGKGQKKQAGGRLVGGLGVGDKVQLLAEPGEVVWNREAVQAMGGSMAANRPNLDFPRFQGGGIVSLGHKLQDQGWLVGEHPAFGGVTPGVHSAIGYHPTGQAIDVNWVPVAQEFAKMKAILPSLQRMKGIVELLSPVPGPTYDAAHAGSNQHLHIAMAAGATVGAIGGAIQDLKRVLITGPDGPLKAIPQAVSDHIRKGANAMLQQKSQHEGLEAGISSVATGAGAISRPEMRKLLAANRMPNWTGWISLAESGLDPRAVSSAGARGLFQIMPFWGGGDRLFDPNFNVAKARHVLSVQGTSAWAPSEHAGHIPEGWGPHQGQRFQKGGMVYKPPHGGAGFVQSFVQSFKRQEGAGERRNLVKDTLETIRTRDAFGVNMLNKDGSLSGRLLELHNFAEQLQEFADNSSALDGEAPWELVKDMGGALPYSVRDDGAIVQAFKTESEAQGLLRTLQDGVLGRFYGKTEGEWLGGIESDPGKLQVMLKLRNRLIEATHRIKSVKEVISRMIEHVEEQVRIVREAIKTGAKVRKDLEEERKQLQKRLETATTDQEKSREAIRKSIDKEVGKPKKERDEGLINRLRELIKKGSPERDAIREELARNHDKMQHLLGAQADRGSLMTALRDKIKPAFKDRLEPLTSGATTVADQLVTTQGSVPQLDFIKGIPEFGFLGGDIFETQRRLKELQFKPSDFTDQTEESDSPGGMNINDLLRFAEAVRLGAFGPVVPGFAQGGFPKGWARVGEKGPELINFGAGGPRVYSNADSKQMLGGSILIIKELKIGETTIAKEVELKLDEIEQEQVTAYRAGKRK